VKISGAGISALGCSGSAMAFMGCSFNDSAV
jgi:hypothetical protein